ncbi:MAG: hypothetical protein ABIQ72_12410 [Usitatibacter sp.]
MLPRERIDPVELAIGRVLEVERAAQESVAGAQASAKARLAAARTQALLVAERAEARLARACASIESRIAAREAQVEVRIREMRADAAPASTQSARIDLAVAAVADALTRAGPP